MGRQIRRQKTSGHAVKATEKHAEVGELDFSLGSDLTVSGALVSDGSNISLDSTSTLNIDCSNTSNGITIGTATSGIPISIGHTTSVTTVNDNLAVTGDLTVAGTTSFSDISITNVGDVALDSISADGTQIDITLTDNNAAALEIKEGSNAYMTFVTTNSGEKVQIDKPIVVGGDGTGQDVTFYSGTAGDHFVWDSSEEKLTITGTNSQTALDIADGNVTIADDLAVAGRIDLDEDNDTSIRASADDVITFEVAGSDELSLSATALYPATAKGLDLGSATNELGNVYLGSGKHIQFGDTQAAWGIDSLTTSNATLGYSSDYSAPVLDAKSTSFTIISSTGTANKPELVITNSTNGHGGGFLSFTKHRGWGGSANRAPIANDTLGGIAFMEGVSDYTPYAEINASTVDVTDDAESGAMKFTVKNTGVDNDDLTLLGGQISIGSGKHIIAIDQDIRYAHNVDNTVIVELPGVVIPRAAIITSVAAVVRTASNLGTHLVNIQMSATSGTGADSAIASGTELLGAGVANTDSTDSTSAEDINLASADEHEVWVCRDTVINPPSADQYVYICNAEGGNGTTDSTAGTLTVIIEYYGYK